MNKQSNLKSGVSNRRQLGFLFHYVETHYFTEEEIEHALNYIKGECDPDVKYLIHIDVVKKVNHEKFLKFKQSTIATAEVAGLEYIPRSAFDALGNMNHGNLI